MRLRNSMVVLVVGLTLACTASANSAVAGHTRGATGGLTMVATSPSWSPDGKQVAFAYVPASCCSASDHYRIVRRSSRRGGAVHTVLAAKGPWPGQAEWTTSGRILVLVSGQLESVSVHGGKPKPLVFSQTCDLDPCVPQGFILSPSREYAAVTTEDGFPHSPWGIQLVRMKPGRHPEVLQMQISGEAFDQALAFSPHSQQLVYSHCQGTGPPTLYGCFPPYELMAVRIPGGTPVPLAQSGIPGAGLVPFDPQLPFDTQVQWSRDGRWLAFIEDGRLEVAPTTGTSAPRVVASCPSAYSSELDFSWSPTSKLIAYDCFGGDSGQLSTVRPNGTHRTHLLKQWFAGYTGPLDGEPVPQWSPDGSRLLAMASGEVWTTRPNGHGLTRLG